MRNLLQYPIVADEILSSFVVARDNLIKQQEQMLGSIDCVSLHLLEKFLTSEAIQNELKRWLAFEQTKS